MQPLCLVNLRAGCNQRLALFVAGELGEVLHEAVGQVNGLRIPPGSILVGVARVENSRINTRQLGRNREVENRQLLGRSLVNRAVEDGVDDATRILNRDTLARTVPARVHEVCRGTRLLHALYQLLTVLGGVQREECGTEACREGRRRLGDAALRTGQLGREARQEVVLRLLGGQNRNRGQYAEGVGREEDDLLGGGSLRYRLYDVLDVENRVRYAGVLRYRLVGEVDGALLVNRNVLQQGVAADGVPDVGLVLLREVDDLA